MTKAAKIRAEIESCRDRNGRLTKAAVLAKARIKGTALFAEFQRRGLWDNKRAAEKARLDHAGELIRRYIVISVINRDVKVTSVGYVKDPSNDHNIAGYRRLDAMDKRSAEQAVDNELSACESIIRRGRAVAAVLDTKYPGLLDFFETALAAIIAARTELKRAA